MKAMIILRGIPGSGKTTFASEVLKGVVCTADDYMIEDGEYKFDPKKLRYAHNSCRKKAEEAMGQAEPIVVIANTNIKKKDYKPYIDLANRYNYKVFIIQIECPLDLAIKRQTHGVPIEKMKILSSELKEQTII